MAARCVTPFAEWLYSRFRRSGQWRRQRRWSDTCGLTIRSRSLTAKKPLSSSGAYLLIRSMILRSERPTRSFRARAMPDRRALSLARAGLDRTRHHLASVPANTPFDWHSAIRNNLRRIAVQLFLACAARQRARAADGPGARPARRTARGRRRLWIAARNRRSGAPRRSSASRPGSELEAGPARSGEGRVPLRGVVSPYRIYRDQLGARQPGGGALLQWARHGGTMDKGRPAEGRDHAAFLSPLSGQRGATLLERHRL